MSMLRPAAQVMDVKRLGAMHQTRLSFMRRLVRQMVRENWSIRQTRWDLNEQGFGTAVYQITTPNGVFSHALFADYLPDEERNDRVIAERWDVTMALCIGELNDDDLSYMRAMVPLQEAGRAKPNMVVLSRGNKSSRNFDYVVDQLAAGRQPNAAELAKVGYLYRTTAVYGSGKFGLADWLKVKTCCPDLAHPFAAEMLSCYLLRQFSVDQAEHLARVQNPERAVPLAGEIKRFLGIGNATGLGMAPFLIRHPLLISRWVQARETALALVKSSSTSCTTIDADRIDRLRYIISKATQHFIETNVADQRQTQRYQVLVQELQQLQSWLQDSAASLIADDSWSRLIALTENTMSLETQELVNTALLELYPELDAELGELPNVDEVYELQPEMSLSKLKELIQTHYDWALDIDFNDGKSHHFFWYVSEEKMEPRLGKRGIDQGEEKELPLVIARRAKACFELLNDYLQANSSAQRVADFLLEHPAQRAIVKRMQTMAQEVYGEIRVNLADQAMLPLDLLRCKLSFFGVGKFDPKSDLWVRNTMFQGAPMSDQLQDYKQDDWFFPVSSEPLKTGLSI